MPPARPTAALATIALAFALLGASGADAVPPAPPAGPAQAELAEPDPTGRGAAPGSPTDYRAPTNGAVLRLFDPPTTRWGRGHRGVDLESSDGVVRSPGAGVISFAGRVVDRGVVTVTHSDGLRSSLEPVSGAPVVGTVVEAGDVIGTPESGSHCGGRVCVHWGVRRGETYLDPLDLLGTRTVVLLPDG